ncbi:MAG: hypothetical protein Tsb005_06140 [Gammaproteobacteria bacterium]
MANGVLSHFTRSMLINHSEIANGEIEFEENNRVPDGDINLTFDEGVASDSDNGAYQNHGSNESVLQYIESENEVANSNNNLLTVQDKDYELELNSFEEKFLGKLIQVEKALKTGNYQEALIRCSLLSNVLDELNLELPTYGIYETKIKYLYGIICFEQEKYEQAINLFKLVLNNNPMHFEAAYYIAISYQKLANELNHPAEQIKKFEEQKQAQVYIEIAEQICINELMLGELNKMFQAKPLQQQGLLALYAGNYETAYAKIVKSIVVDPYNDDAWFCLAFSAYKVGFFAQAISCCKQLLKKNPDDYKAICLLLDCLMMSAGNYQKMAFWIDKLLTCQVQLKSFTMPHVFATYTLLGKFEDLSQQTFFFTYDFSKLVPDNYCLELEIYRVITLLGIDNYIAAANFLHLISVNHHYVNSDLNKLLIDVYWGYLHLLTFNKQIFNHLETLWQRYKDFCAHYFAEEHHTQSLKKASSCEQTGEYLPDTIRKTRLFLQQLTSLYNELYAQQIADHETVVDEYDKYLAQEPLETKVIWLFLTIAVYTKHHQFQLAQIILDKLLTLIPNHKWALHTQQNLMQYANGQLFFNSQLSNKPVFSPNSEDDVTNASNSDHRFSSTP